VADPSYKLVLVDESVRPQNLGQHVRTAQNMVLNAREVLSHQDHVHPTCQSTWHQQSKKPIQNLLLKVLFNSLQYQFVWSLHICILISFMINFTLYFIDPV
jgi:hypothetical protein